jgi:hypothetical protein
VKASLLAAVLAVHTPYAEPFWARNLHGLVLRLAEPPNGPVDTEQQRLFGDVVRFLNCEPLPALKEEEPAWAPRALLRLEVARRGRLGASAATSPTLWRDVLTPDFFRRTSSFAQGELLRWPVEEERWSDETLEVKLSPSACTTPLPSSDELPQLTAALLEAVEKGAGPETVARLRYHRGARLLAAGEVDAAKEEATRLSPEALTEALRPHARLLRVALELTPREEYVALALEPALEPVRVPVIAQAAAHLSSEGRWQELLALTAPYAQAPGPTTPAPEAVLRRDLLYRRALAHHALGEREALDALLALVFPSQAASQEPVVEAMRGTALASLSRGALDARALALVKDLGVPGTQPKRLAQLGSLALGVGNVRTALDASERLLQEKGAPSRARGHALRAEVALASGDAPALTRSIERLLAQRNQGFVPPKDQEEVDRIALALVQTLVTASADLTEPRWRPLLASQLEAVRLGVHSRHEKTFPALLAALEDRPALPPAKGKRAEAFVAVGQVAVGVPLATLPPPPFSVEWPEPYSLLALPLPDGSPRDWFPRESPTPAAAPAPTGAEVPHAP